MASSAFLHPGPPAAVPSKCSPAPTLRFVEKRRSVPKERQRSVVEACILLLGDTASSLAGKMSFDLFPLVVISTTTITEIHHFLSREWRAVGVCFSSGVDRKLFILSSFGKTSCQRSPAGALGGGRRKETVGTIESWLGPLPLAKPPPQFAFLKNGENHSAKRDRGRQHEAALGVKDNGPIATNTENNNKLISL